MSRQPQTSTPVERGRRVKWARELVEPNRAEFARKLRIDTSTIRNIENGSRNPSYELLERICHALRISVEYVVQGRLSGVDPELAALLATAHQELLPKQPTRAGILRRDAHTNTSDEPTTQASW